MNTESANAVIYNNMIEFIKDNIVFMDDSSLKVLSNQIYTEQRLRTRLNTDKYPIPVLSGDRIADIRNYRATYNCSFMVAREVVDFHTKANGARPASRWLQSQPLKAPAPPKIQGRLLMCERCGEQWGSPDQEYYDLCRGCAIDTGAEPKDQDWRNK